jgi:hypothetical protein
MPKKSARKSRLYFFILQVGQDGRLGRKDGESGELQNGYVLDQRLWANIKFQAQIEVEPCQQGVWAANPKRTVSSSLTSIWNC